MRASFLLTLSCILSSLLTGCKQPAPAAMSMAAGPPVVPVSVAKATQETVPNEIRVVGNAEASAIVQVKSQIAGELVKVNFTEGQNVQKGELLFQVDDRPYRDALNQAQAAVQRDRAQIAQNQAMLARDNANAKVAQSEADRQAELSKDGLTPRSQYDQAQATADANKASARATQAGIESAQAALRSDEAAVGAAQLNLSYCQITAPISGRTGNLLVHAGNLVKVNDVPLVVINQLAPIFVNFNVPEQHLNAIRRRNTGRGLPVRVFSQDNPGRSATGRLVVIDNTVDTATGTIHLKAGFENKDGMLWPGQFLTVVLTLDDIPNATVIPSEAVQAGQRGQFVYVVKPDNSVEIRPVSVASTMGGKTVIASGVAPGDTVVTDGQLRLFPGATIKAVDAGKLGTGPL
ncbi:MAG TPA: efflux RND transporter periplasmic adaptor subunit [Candidatus Sulfopaludibacter sp.]|nr:efflux RND transporter periplasmic adaptor subunit [Candidatus Sulfopaludibacter sp.]